MSIVYKAIVDYHQWQCQLTQSPPRAGPQALELAGVPIDLMPFCGGRTDAPDGAGSADLEPTWARPTHPLYTFIHVTTRVSSLSISIPTPPMYFLCIHCGHTIHDYTFSRSHDLTDHKEAPAALMYG